jgi:Pentapeptide repeats (8 copies)/Trypsin-like peptidase domain
MIQDFRKSIVLVAHKDKSNIKDFGTGFVIYHDKQISYVLTCAHVLKDIGNIENVVVGGSPVKEVILGDTSGCDLAVLIVKDELTKKQALVLGTVGRKGARIIISGFYTDSTKTRKLADINGKLGDGNGRIENIEGEHIPIWTLRTTNDSENEIQAGYSGSPVVDVDTGYTIGVFINQTFKDKGEFIKIEALDMIWKTMPLGLIEDTKDENYGGQSIPTNPTISAPEKTNFWKVIICTVIMIILAIIITNELQRQRAEKIAIEQEAVLEEASEEINSEDVKVRISGIEKMEKIFNDSEEKQWIIVRALAKSITRKHPASKPLNKRTDQTRSAEDTNKSLNIIKKTKVESGKIPNEIITLKESNLYDVDLSEAQLPNVDFNRSYLYQANLSNSNFKNAHFNGAYLRGANLNKSNLMGSDLEGADLLKANLEGTNLFKVNLEGANFTDEQIKQACNWNLARYDGETKRRLKPDNTKKIENCS